MPKLRDDEVWQLIEAAIRERRFNSYVHWEPQAQQELEKDSELTCAAVNEALADVVRNQERPDVEIQKGGAFDGQQRYVWRMKIDATELYVKTNVERDHLDEACLTIVRCHVGWY